MADHPLISNGQAKDGQPLPRRAIGYVRVSTDEQAESGLGLDAQRATLRAAAEREGLDLVATFADEGLSGGAGLEDRPGLAQALESLRRGSVLVVAKRDRLARDYMLAGFIELEAKRRGATVVSAAGEGNGHDDDPSAWLLSRIVDLFAHYERLMIRARTRAALRAKRDRGERTSRHAPYGHRHDPDGRLVAHAGEQAAIARAHELASAGLSLRAIAAHLEGEGHTGRTGRRLTPSTIRAALGRG